MTDVVLGIAAVIALLLTFLSVWGDVIGQIPAVIWISVITFFIALIMLCNRFFLTMGYKNQRKVMEKKAQE